MVVTLISFGAIVPLAVKWPLHTRRVSRKGFEGVVTANIIQSVYPVGKGRLKESCGLESRTNLFRLRNLQKVVRIRFGCELDSRIYGILYKQGLYTSGNIPASNEGQIFSTKSHGVPSHEAAQFTHTAVGTA
jgi:hypothetical protein